MTELRETEPGYFVAVEGASPFPLAIRIEVPSTGRLIYTWSFGEPGGELAMRNTADVMLVDLPSSTRPRAPLAHNGRQ